MNTQTIEAMAQELSEKNSWVRKEWENIMKMFSAIETDDKVSVKLCTDTVTQTDQWLVLGEDDLLEGGYGDLISRETEYSWRRTWECFSVREIRKLILSLPATMEKIKAIIENKQINNTKCEEIINKLK